MDNPKPKIVENDYTSLSYPICNKAYLDRNILSLQQTFQSVLITRKTSRNFNVISNLLLSSVLWYSAKVIDIKMQENGFMWSHRYVPSAGGRHPIDIIVSPPIAISERKLFLYNPVDHSLNELCFDNICCQAFFNHIDNIQLLGDATVFWFVADQQRTESKYENPLSLIWRDAGALMYGLQLVCCAFDLACCPLGTLGEPFISDFFKINGSRSVFGVGGCLVG